MAGYGAYTYESTESRALKSITADSYNKDQAKNLIQLNQNSEYMAQYLRKLQKGVDEASQNVIEQFQSFINDIIVLLGGGGNTGLDFGDLKYIFMAIGSLFGFTNSSGEIQLPVNLFQAAWHFFSSYILPGANFDEVINGLIDQAIAQILDIFGDVPIIGEAVQQLAVILSDLRDALAPLIAAVEALFGAFGGNWFTLDLGMFTDIFGAVTSMFAPLIGPPIQVLTQMFGVIATWTMPFIQGLTNIIEVVTNMIRSITGGLSFSAFTDGNFNLFGAITSIVQNIVNNISQFPLGLLYSGAGPNLLVQPNFDDSDSLSMGVGWTWDSAQGRTSGGSARATASGFKRELVSVPIPVTAGNGAALDASVWIKWMGLAYTGNSPIGVYINKYLNGNLVGADRIATVLSPALNQSAWTKFSGSWTVPSGCDRVRLAFRVESNATGGQVWFDDSSLNKQGQTLPQLFVTGLTDAISGLQQFIQNVVDGIISAIRGIPFIGGAIADLLEEIADWFDGTEHTAAVAADAKMGVQATQDIIVSGITASPQADVDDSQIQAAVDSQTSTIISQGAALEALTSQLNGQTNSGVNVIDTFEETFVGQMNPALWQKFQISGTASMDTSDGHNAMMAGPNGEVFYRYIGPNNHTNTPFQRVTATIASSLRQPGFGDGRRPKQSVYCRVSDDGTKWVRLSFDNLGHCIVDYRNGAASGEFYRSGDFAIPAPGAGSSMTIEPGVGVDANKYRIWKGNTPLFIVTDTDNLTDQTQLGYGMGLYQDAGFGCGGFTQFTASDNAQAQTVGIGFRGYASTNRGGAGDGVFPANAIDTVDRIGANMSFNKTTQTLTINTEGWYLFEVAANTGSVGTGRRATYLYKVINGVDTVVGIYGDAGLTQIGSGNRAQFSMSTSYIGNLPIFYAEAGSQWKPGCTGGTISGDAAGISTVFAAVLLNRSLN